MASIQNITHQPSSLRLNEPSQKRGSEGSRPLQNPGSNNTPSFQELLAKPDNQPQAVSEKGEDRSGHQGEPRDERAGQDSRPSSSPVVTVETKPVAAGDIGISRPAPEPIPQTYYLPPTIIGTEGSDFLLGTSGHDIIDGLGGNDILLGGGGQDRLMGGEGNDWLLGGRDNDRLEGGKGNDWLLGGRGNDSLDGGQGSDRLYGGSGNDTLADEHGTNQIDGGQGFDTFKLGKGIDSYHISVNKQGEFTIQELSRRVDSPRHTVKNIESFQFADVTISAKDLQDRVNNPIQDLSLSKPQKAAVESVFNIDNASVRDNDRDGKISAGDTVSGTVFSEANPFKEVSFDASQDNADHINGAFGSELSLSPERLLEVDRVVNPDNNLNNQSPVSGAIPPEFDFQAAGVLDTDKSGGLSEGDVVYSRPGFITTGGDPIAASPVYHRLTADDIQQINTNNDNNLPLSPAQIETVESVFNIDGAAVQDNDGDGIISAGDMVSGTVFSESGPFPPNQLFIEVSQDNADHINGVLGSDLPLSTADLQRVDAVANPDPLNYMQAVGVLDADKSGGLSEGDVVYSYSNLATTGGDPIAGGPTYHRLTADDIQQINRDNRLELSPAQQASLNEVFSIRGEQGASVLDNDGNGLLSQGDTVVVSGGITGGEISRFDLTADQVSHINGELGAIPEVSNAGINLTEGKDVPFTQVGEIVVSKQQLPSYLDKPFEQHIISSQSQLNQLRADLGLPVPDRFGGGLPGTELPKVDFNEQVLVYTVRDAADPNITQSNFKLSDEGTLSSLVTSTKIGFEASDEAQLTFMSLSREGVEEFANSDPINGENPGTVIVPPDIDNQEVREALEDNKQKWLDAGLTHYRYTLERSCFCTEEARRPVDNTFDNGALTSVFHDGNEGEVPESNQLNVKDMFKLIDEALSRGADDIQVEYDSRLGHPTSIYIDYDQRLADEELSLTIRNLHPGLVYEVQDPVPVSKLPVELDKPELPMPSPDVAVAIESTGPKGFQPPS